MNNNVIPSYTGNCAFNYWVQVVQDEGLRDYTENQRMIRFSGPNITRNKKHKPVTEARCLRVEPSWMFDNKELLGDLRLKDILLTGTHDAAAYK